MPIRTQHNNKGQAHGKWGMSYEHGGYIEGYHLNGERVGYWEFCSAISLTMIYYAR